MSVIKVENLFKKYVLRHQTSGRSRYVSLRDTLAQKATSLFRHNPGGNEGQEEFSALKDVSFEVKRGESVGIIGRNGAGKSTLLKILSRITEPTSGRIEIDGRVASLLEVGTGFHPELTGRENIYLNGAILGMKRPEIKRKFDEIVAFAEVEKFLDTPVKHFSSGMYMRLAFAVAAHLDSEILIVDEVLAVGDAEFQRKCLGKMDEASRHGRTVLFVSHNMQAVENLTARCVLFSNGRIAYDGASADAVSLYIKSRGKGTEVDIDKWTTRVGSGEAHFISLVLQNQNGEAQEVFRPSEPIHFRIRVNFAEEILFDIQLVIEDEKEQPMFTTQLCDSREAIKGKGDFEFVVKYNQNYLLPGNYLISLAAIRPDHSICYDGVHNIPVLTIEGEGSQWKVPTQKRWGNFFFPCEWISER